MEESTVANQERLARNEFFAQIFSIAMFAVASLWKQVIWMGFVTSAPLIACIVTSLGTRRLSKGATFYGRLMIGYGILLGALTTYYWIRVVFAIGPTEILQALAK